jgi:5-formyltetrahydrofolate cyclo-ligase
MEPSRYAAEPDPPTTRAKQAVRGRLRAQRRELVPARDRAADAEAIALDGLHAAHEARVDRGDWVAAYQSTELEPPTEALIASLTARGIRVMVPITLEDWDLDWREVGTTTPLGVDAIGGARLVFLPAHAVDSSGTRIGQGKGCYDRAMMRTTCALVAIVHPWEVVDETLPRDAHDRPVDAVIAAGLGLRAVDR